MKLIIFALSLIISTQATAKSFDTNVRLLNSSLEVVHLDENVHFFYKNMKSGSVTIDHQNKEILLTVQPPMPSCPNNEPCFQLLAMPTPITITTKITHQSNNICGSIVIEAEQFDSAGVGIEEKITVIDNSTSTCMYLIPVPAIEVIHESYDATTQIETLSSFKGQPLRPIKHRTRHYQASDFSL